MKKKITRKNKETYIYKNKGSIPPDKEFDSIFKKWKGKTVFVSIEGWGEGKAIIVSGGGAYFFLQNFADGNKPDRKIGKFRYGWEFDRAVTLVREWTKKTKKTHIKLLLFWMKYVRMHSGMRLQHLFPRKF